MIHELTSIALLATSIALTMASILLLKKTFKYYKALRAMLESRTPSVKKPRKRYIVFSLLCEEPRGGEVSRETIEKVIVEKIVEYYGQDTLHKASPYVVFFDERTLRGVVRATHAYVDYVVAALGLVKNIDNNKCIAVPIRTTGTLKRAQEYVTKIKI